jgi:hypothetical protein
MAGDLKPVVQQPFVWEAATARNTVNDLYKILVEKTNTTIQWYLDKKKGPAGAAQTCRNAAVFLTVLGGLCPILKTAYSGNLFDKITFGDLGYVLLAFALAIVLVDKYAGYSTAWMRYIKTNMRLEGMLQDFQYDWQITCVQSDFDRTTPEAEKVVKLLTKLKDFAKQVSVEIENETQEWVTEFQQSLALLAKASEDKKKDDKARQTPPPDDKKLSTTGDTAGHA